MNRIHVLPPDVSDKIAAGEVVENPASVVKELIENALDAGADSITVEIKNGGVSLIRVTDNGGGMSAAEAETAFLRHATSKISGAADLEAIATLGFRGEALSSIAAVSDIELITKAPGGEGCIVQVQGGALVSSQPMGCPDGTTILVKKLFYNTPARMKFLKSDKTETGYVTNIVQRLVLGNPNIAVKYIADGKERLFFGGGGDLSACVYSVYGREFAKGSVAVSRRGDAVSVEGLAGRAELSRGNRGMQSFFVNGRYVKSRALTYAAEAAYKNILMTGRFPFFALHLTVPFSSVDINVHPSKQEVKFENERMVCDEVYWAVKNALAGAADDFRRDLLPPSRTGFAPPVQRGSAPTVFPQVGFMLASQTPDFPAFFQSGPVEKAPGPERPVSMAEPVAELPALVTGQPEEAVFPPGSQEETALPLEAAPPYRVIGQLFDTYILIETQGKIVMIDQHAAHERMIYERLLKSVREKEPLSQMLLAPIAVTLSPTEYAVFTENAETFSKLGFETEEFGNNSILVRCAPADIGAEGLKLLLLELIESVSKSGAEAHQRQEALLAMVSCKAALKGSQRLHPREIAALIDEVLRAGGISTCPHGRPLTVTLTRYQLDKMFKRIV